MVASANSLRGVLSNPLAKLLLLGLVWAYLHHLLAGVRHLPAGAADRVCELQRLGHQNAAAAFGRAAGASAARMQRDGRSRP